MKPSMLLSAEGLQVTFHEHVHAVRHVSLQLQRAEVLAVVGESGSGKSTLARALMGMQPVQAGHMTLDGAPLAADARHRPVAQRRKIGMVFQDSAAAFNPRFTIERILQEPLTLISQTPGEAGPPPTLHGLLDAVALPASVLRRRPHELSGGQRQRVGIARALAARPDLLICDEAVSALDVSVQAQILNLLIDLQAERNLGILFITHDLAVVSYMADRVAVMRHGELLETGDVNQILDAPRHDYTRSLLAAGLS